MIALFSKNSQVIYWKIVEIVAPHLISEFIVCLLVMERELVVDAFSKLGSADQKTREDSNRLLLQVLQSPSIWSTAKVTLWIT